jgi:uncharacterized protein (TIGR02147 family)
LGNNIQARLASSTTLREFLKGELKDGRRSHSTKDHRKSYAAFARKAGFSTRSYPREVCLGIRKITAKTLPGFIAGLCLKGDAAKCFRDMAALEYPELNFENLETDVLLARIEKLKKNLTKKRTQPVFSQRTSIFKNWQWPYVFSALGSEERGATLQDLEQRLQLPAADVSHILNELVEANMIRIEGDQVFPISEKLVFKEDGNGGAFRDFFLKTIKSAEHSARVNFAANDELYFNSVFSIPTERLPEFKNELRSLLLNFIQDSEDPNGSSIVTLVTALSKAELKSQFN